MTGCPKVLQVLPALNQGGVERATIDVAMAITKTYGVKTYIASHGGVLENILCESVCHIKMPLHTKNPLKMMGNIFALYKVIKEFKIDVVHARSRGPAWSAWLACLLTKTPFVTTYHAAYKSGNRFKPLYNAIMARGHRVITISKFIDDLVENRHPRAQRDLIYEGIDINYFSKDAEFDRLDRKALFQHDLPLLFVPSRQTPIKGIETVVHAVSEMRGKVNLILIETGKEAYISHIKSLIENLNVSDYVTWLSQRSDLRPYYEVADIVVVPSVQPEALGRVNIEALSMEKMLISSNLGANSESCIAYKTGFLFEPGDVRSLIQEITRTLSMDEREKHVFRESGRQLVESRFNLRTTIKKTIQLYQSLLK